MKSQAKTQTMGAASVFVLKMKATKHSETSMIMYRDIYVTTAQNTVKFLTRI